MLPGSCFRAVIRRFVDRRAQERDPPWLEHMHADEEQPRPRKPHEEEKLRREESVKKKDSEEKGKQEMQDKLSRLFHQHQEPGKPAVQAPWSTAGTRANELAFVPPDPLGKHPCLLRLRLRCESR